MCDIRGHEFHEYVNRPTAPSLSFPESHDINDDISVQLSGVPEQGGLYFFRDESPCRAKAGLQRIARIGKAENLRLRLLWHLSSDQTPWYRQGKVRSIFRQHVGRCLFRADGNRMQIWEKSGQPGQYQYEGDIPVMEREVSAYIRNSNRRFVWIVGSQLIALEHAIIGCLARCACNKPQAAWLGNHHPNPSIVKSGLWNVRGVNDGCPQISLQDMLSGISRGAAEREIQAPARLGKPLVGPDACAQAVIPIPYTRASFYPAIFSAVREYIAQHDTKFPVGGVVGVKFSAKGYNGSVRVRISDDQMYFHCDTPDVNGRFPARIKNAPAALFDSNLRGCYQISHSKGLVRITRLA